MTAQHETAFARTPVPPLSRTEMQTVIAAAGMAPSIHNTQPWAFEAHGATVDLHADFDRALRWSVDPDGRQLMISCGAALFNLRVAAAHIGRGIDVRLLPDPEHATLLARARFGPRSTMRSADANLFPAIRRRHTHRHAFEPRAVPGAVLGELAECVRSEHGVLTPIGKAQRRWLFDLVAFAEVLLTENPGYTADLTKWTAGSTARHDGVPVSAFGTLADNGTPPMRDFGHGHWFSPPHEHYGYDPLVAILSTAADDRVAWLQAGQALQRLLLVATNRGLAASFLNQPLDSPTIRKDLTGRPFGGFPQMILRLGYATGIAATPRRPVNEVLREHDWH